MAQQICSTGAIVLCPEELERLADACSRDARAAAAPCTQTDVGASKEAVQSNIALSTARSALVELRAKLTDFDAEYKVSDSAAMYLREGIQKAQTALDDVSAVMSHAKDRTVEAHTAALSAALTSASKALSELSETASTYDEKFGFSSKVRHVVQGPQEKCLTAVAQISDLATSAASRASDQIKDVHSGVVSRVAVLANCSATLAFSAAAALESRFDIETKACAMVNKAQQMDDEYAVRAHATTLASRGLERAQGFDDKITGGKLTPVVTSALEKSIAAAVGGFSFVQAGYENAKTQRSCQVCTESGAASEAVVVDLPNPVLESAARAA